MKGIASKRVSVVVLIRDGTPNRYPSGALRRMILCSAFASV